MGKLFWSGTLALDSIINRLKGSQVVAFNPLDLGSWDMDATASKTWTVGTTAGVKNLTDTGRVSGFHVVVRNDAGVKYIDHPELKLTVDGDDIVLTRDSAGAFDTTDFDDTTIDRGELILLLSV